ncbi:hypothetical protein YPPY66_3869, partial [Yersinia pestis PY-66]
MISQSYFDGTKASEK